MAVSTGVHRRGGLTKQNDVACGSQLSVLHLERRKVESAMVTDGGGQKARTMNGCVHALHG